MNRESQQSSERSRNSMTGLRAAVAGATLLGMSLVVSERPASPVSPENPTLASAEYALSLMARVKSTLLDPESAIAEAIRRCKNLVTIEVHAPQDDPEKDIVNTRVNIRNATNPSEVVTVRADRQHNWNSDRSDINTVVDGTSVRSFLLSGVQTGQIECNRVRIHGVTPSEVCSNGEKVDSTTIEGMQINQNGTELKGYWSKAEVPCKKNEEICQVRLNWVNDVKSEVVKEPEEEPEVAPVCPQGTNPVYERGMLICERPVPSQPPISQ